jgi:predicted membrane-bound spermidine synthase
MKTTNNSTSKNKKREFRMTRDLKIVFFATLALVALNLVFVLCGLTSPATLFNRYVSGDWSLANISILFSNAALFVFFSRPSRRELALIFGAGLAMAPACLWAVALPWSGLPVDTWIFTGTTGVGLAALAVLVLRLRHPEHDFAGTCTLLAAWLLGPLIALAAYLSLELTMALHPQTLDLYLYKFEASLGFQASRIYGLVVDASPALHNVLLALYAYLPSAVPIFFAIQVARRTTAPANIILVQLVSAAVAWTLFQFFPATGPKYAFGQLYPHSLPLAQDLAASWLGVMPAARNAMPSMHFGWSLALWLNSLYLGNRWLRAAMALLLGANVLATLGLGEHYLIDLVVAVPCVMAVQALCTQNLAWNDPARRRMLAWGSALTLAWLLALRFGLEVFLSVPGLSWLAILATLAGSVALYRPLHRAAAAALAREPAKLVLEPVLGPVLQSIRANIGWRIAGLFVLSGFAGLVYQVLFSKALALTFGSTSTATYTVLATYMGGMALGAWLGGAIAARRTNPLVLYALCELGIGLYCLATPLFFPLIRDAYVALAAGMAPDAPALLVARFGIGAAALVAPTVLMGMTLPILVRFFEQRDQGFGASVAWLYAANTGGAALGALLAGYAILPALGMTRTTLIAVAINLLAAYLGFRLSKSPLLESRERAPAASAAKPAARLDVASNRALSYLALAVLGIGGIVTLALEVHYVHLLSVVAGNSVYAFSLMLFAFLFGLGLGSEVARRLLRQRWPLASLLAGLDLGLACAIALGIVFWDSLPQYFASFQGYDLTPGFGGREAIRGLVCLVAMVPAAFFIGAIYPVAMEAIARGATRSPVAALGRAAALNTAGNILGVLVGGFVLLPQLGALLGLKLLASVCFALGAAALALGRGGGRPALSWGTAAGVALLLVVTPRSFDYDSLASGANVYFKAQGFGKVIDRAESVDGGLTTVAVSEQGGGKVLTLLTNGKFQGNDAWEGEVKAQVGFSLAPLLHVGARDRALVIGYGTGMSARVLHEAGFAHLDIADLSGDIIRLANRHFADLNARVSELPGVRTYVTDGRNLLLLQNERYDLVAMELSSIWFAGTASLYNRDFYELVRARLKPSGVLQQWVQLHHMRPADLFYVLGSVRNVFRYVSLYYIGGQGIIVASNDPAMMQTAENIAKLDRTPGLKRFLALYGDSAKPLASTLVLGPQGIDRYLASRNVPLELMVSTDDNLFLEYGTPKGNALDGSASLEQNLKLLSNFR